MMRQRPPVAMDPAVAMDPGVRRDDTEREVVDAGSRMAFNVSAMSPNAREPSVQRSPAAHDGERFMATTPETKKAGRGPALIIG